VLDGEVVCLDGTGRPDFNALLFRPRTPVFVAFDVLAVGGRRLPLLRRKALLRVVLPARTGCVLNGHHVAEQGSAVSTPVCAADLEGVVMKPNHGTYSEPSSWVIKNRGYTGVRGRHEPDAPRGA
jgi:bifunctional non-homologous end joining protein LigD